MATTIGKLKMLSARHEMKQFGSHNAVVYRMEIGDEDKVFLDGHEMPEMSFHTACRIAEAREAEDRAKEEAELFNGPPYSRALELALAVVIGFAIFAAIFWRELMPWR